MGIQLFIRYSVIIGSALVVTACDCTNTVLQEIPDPSGTIKAVIFQRDCGTFGGTSAQLSILPMTRQNPFAGGNVFSAMPTTVEDPELLVDDTPALSATWINLESLHIAYNARLSVYQAVPKIGPITLAYEARQSQPEPEEQLREEQKLDQQPKKSRKGKKRR